MFGALITGFRRFRFVGAVLGFCTALPFLGAGGAVAGIQYVPESGNIHVPSSAWLVGPAVSPVTGGRGQNPGTCVMANQYDNGFVVRIAGGGGSLMAMSVDFREDAFIKGRKYNISLIFQQGSSISAAAAAYDPGTLVLDLRSYAGAYDSIRQSDEMTIRFDDRELRFSLAGVARGLERLEECHSPSYRDMPEQVPGMRTAVARPSAFGASEVLPEPQAEPEAVSTVDAWSSSAGHGEVGGPVSITADVNWNGERLEVSGSKVTLPERSYAGEEYSGGRRAEPQPPMLWRARQGEDIRTVLAQWSQIAGYDFVWQSSGEGKVRRDFSYEGDFESAVAELMSQTGNSGGISARIEGGDNQGYVAGPSAGPQEIYASVTEDGTYWHGIKGTDMRSVLQMWSREAGVELVWDSDVSFRLKRAVNYRGSFEAAVQAVLEQFTYDDLRPLGTMHMEDGNRKFLVIRSGDSS